MGLQLLLGDISYIYIYILLSVPLYTYHSEIVVKTTWMAHGRQDVRVVNQFLSAVSD